MPKMSEPMYISVVIPAYNESGVIRSLSVAKPYSLKIV